MGPHFYKLACLLLLGLFSTSNCGQKAAPTTNEVRTLTNGIYMADGGCDVDFPIVNLIIHKNHQIRWESVDGKAYTIVFPKPGASNPAPGTPFGPLANPTLTFVVPANGTMPPAVPLRAGDYAYFIKDAQGNKCMDPG